MAPKVFAAMIMAGALVSTSRAQIPANDQAIRVGVYPAEVVRELVGIPDSLAHVHLQALDLAATSITALVTTALAEHSAFRPLDVSKTVAAFESRTDLSGPTPDQIALLCEFLQLQQLLLPSLHVMQADTGEFQWRLMLRLFDGRSGQLNKMLIRQFSFEESASGKLQVRFSEAAATAITRDLLNSPMMVLPELMAPAELPHLSNAPHSSQLRSKRAKWPWFVVGALAGSTTAYWLFSHSKNDGPHEILPTPPPPPQ